MIDPPPNESPDEGDDHDDEHSTTSNTPGGDDIHLPGGHAGASPALPTPSKQLHTKPFAEFPPLHADISADVFRRITTYADGLAPVTALKAAMLGLLTEYITVCQIEQGLLPLASLTIEVLPLPPVHARQEYPVCTVEIESKAVDTRQSGA